MSLYVSKYKSGWRVIEEKYVDKKRIQKTIPKESYTALGIDSTWTIDKAKSRVKELNHSKASQKIVLAASRVVKISRSKSVWLPSDEVKEFESYLKRINMGSQKHFEKRLMMWGTAQKIIENMDIEPKEYSDYAKGFFNYCIQKQYSVDYSKKLIGLINQWSNFWSRKRNSHFEPIPYPTSREKDKIDQSYRNKEHNRSGGSRRLTPELLNKIKGKIKEDYYDFLFISLWFGLRPEEIENPQFTTYIDTQYNLPILRLFQPKVGKWKHIPILHPEQKEALSLLRPLKRPLNKMLKTILGDKFTCYAGRKGFEPLMRTLGETKSDVSSWLGHSSVRTTDQYYSDNDRVVISRKVS